MKRSLVCAAAAISVFIATWGHAATIIKPPEIKVSGYSQFGYTRDDSKTVAGTDYAYDDSFRMLKARVNFKGDIDARTSLNLQIDLADASSGTVSKLLTDGYIDLKYLKGHTVRAGQFKLPFGLENPISDSKTYPIDGAIVRKKAINTRDIGLDLFAKQDKYEYHVAVINGTGQNKTDDNSKKDYIVSAQGQIADRVKIGGSLLSGGGSPAQTTFRHAVDGFILYTPPMGEVSLEFIKGRDKTAVKKDGWYLTITPMLNPRTWLVLRHENYDPDNSKTSDRVTRETLGILYRTSKYSLVKANYEWRSDDGKTNEGDAFKLMLQVEY